MFAAVGVHPTELENWESEEPAVRLLLESAKVVAIGEIGLDFVRATASREQQREAFRVQLDWAAERGLPVSIHNRGADRDVLEMVSMFAGTAVLHCFSGSQEYAAEALDQGCFLSFAGNVTFPRAEVLRAVAAWVPLDRVLVESDAPVLAPQPWRGRRNEPAYTKITAETVAAVRNLDLPSLTSALTRNAHTVFGWGVS